MKKIIASLLTTFALLATPASAADTPFYAGVQIGDATSFLGGYQIDKTISAEFLYTDYNEYATSMGVFGVAMFPNLIKGNPQISLFGKVGIVRTTVEYSTPYFCGFAICFSNAKATSTDLAIGGGAQYDFNKNVSARLGLDWDDYDSNLYIGAIYKF
jgi:opacity protein-like surface antigen